MQYFRALRIISLVLAFVMVTFGLMSCAGRAASENDTDFGFTAEAVSEGILLTFNNIPPDSIRLFISVQSWDDTEKLKSSYDLVSSIADIRETSCPGRGAHSLQLERVKETGKVFFPIVQAGQKYRISASIQTRSDIDNETIPTFIENEVIAKNGIYFNREDVILELNDTNSTVTLLSEPLFSSEVNFYTNKFDFGVTIVIDEQGSIGTGTHHIPEGLSSDGLTWTFEPQMSENLRRHHGDLFESGKSYSAWAVTYVNIIYDDIVWSVEIAKTPKFNFSL